MARLLNDDRRFIISKLLSRAFNEADQALKNEGAVLHDKLCVDAFGEHWSVVKKLPTDLFKTSIQISLRVSRRNRDTTYLKLSGHTVHVVPARFEHSISLNFDYTLPTQYRVSAEIAAAVTEWVKRRTEHDDAYETAEKDITRLLRGISTYAKLFAVWPELAGIIPEPPTVTTKNQQLAPFLPALNKTLGLPVCETPSPSKKPVATGSKKRRTKAS